MRDSSETALLLTQLQGRFIAFTLASLPQVLDKVAESLRMVLQMRKKQVSLAGDTTSPQSVPDVCATLCSEAAPKVQLKATPAPEVQTPVSDSPVSMPGETVGVGGAISKVSPVMHKSLTHIAALRVCWLGEASDLYVNCLLDGTPYQALVGGPKGTEGTRPRTQQHPVHHHPDVSGQDARH